MLEICYIYRWATLGGVERMLLTRAKIFKDYGIPVKSYVYFLSDAGGKRFFKKLIHDFKLTDYIEVVERIPEKSDLFFLIDTPEVFENIKSKRRKIFFEIHTPYKENRTYLKDFKDFSGLFLVPSQSFKGLITSEYPFLKDKVYVLRNAIVEWGLSLETNYRLPKWKGILLFYVGRMDSLKNPEVLLKALAMLKDRVPEAKLILLGPSTHEINPFSLVEKYSLWDRVIFLPPVSFEKVEIFLTHMSSLKSIFVSPSKGESFGLSSAEAMWYNIPVILMDIPAHRELCENCKEVLYKPGDAKELCQRLIYVINNYKVFKEKVSKWREKFKPEVFLEDWKAFTEIIREV